MLIKKIKEQIEKCRYPKKDLNRLSLIFRDAILYNNCNTSETIIKKVPSIIDSYLKVKHSIQTSNNKKSDFDNIWDDVFGHLFFVVKENIDNLQGCRVDVLSAFSLGEILKEALKYSSPDVIEKASTMITRFYMNRLNVSREWDFFVSSLLGDKDLNNKNQVVNWLFEYYDKLMHVDSSRLRPLLYHFSKEEHLSRLELNDNFFEYFFNYALMLDFDDEENAALTALALSSLWLASPDEMLNRFLSNIDCSKDLYKYLNGNLKPGYYVISHVIEECKKHPRNKIKELRHIELVNLNYYMNFTKQVDAVFDIKLAKSDLIEWPIDCEMVFKNLIANGDNNDINFFGKSILTDITKELERSDDAVIDETLSILEKMAIHTKNTDSSEKISVVIGLVYFVLDYFDKNNIIDDLNFKRILDNHFGILENLYYTKSIHFSAFYDTIDWFSPDRCTFSFINSKSKKMKIEYILNKVFSFTVSSIEDQNDDILRTSSSFIGYCLLFFLHDNNLFYRDVMKKYALKMFDVAISLNYKENVLYYLGTLFVINISYCLSTLKSDARHNYGLSVLEQLPNKHLNIILKSISLRNAEADSFHEYFGSKYLSSLELLHDNITHIMKKRKATK